MQFDSDSEPDVPVGREAPDTADAACMFCQELFSENAAGELWVRCLMCQLWAHNDCAGPEFDTWICDFLLPAMTHQYAIKLQGKVEMGDAVASILKSLYSQLSPEDGQNFDSLIQNIASIVQEKEQSNEKEADLVHGKPLFQEVMEKNQVVHIYGHHDEKGIRNKKDFYNNIHL